MKKVAPPKTNSSRLNVHFELFSPNAHEVCIAGTFNDWEPDTGKMSQQPDGKWVRNLTLKPGTYEYRFVVDGKWEADPNADHTVMNPYGERNSLLTVTEGTPQASPRGSRSTSNRFSAPN
jgi:1,4-alpha-glucan branching enzyme